MDTIIRELSAIVADAEAHRGAYFFRPPTSAGARRAYERKHSHAAIDWTEGKHHYSAEFGVSCSCNYIYTYSTYYKDDKKTNLTAIRNSLKRLIIAEARPFVRAALLAEADRQPMTESDAGKTIREWIREGVDIPAGLSAKILSQVWNDELGR